LTVTADNQSKVYGASVPTLTASITGFVNGETAASIGLTGTPDLSTTSTTNSPVTGSPFTITVTNGTLSGVTNYQFVFVNGLLTVTPAPLTATITANDKTYDGTTVATIASANLSGIVGNDDVSVSGGSASFASKSAGTAKTVTATGLTLSGAAAGNYQLASTSTTALADITPRPLLVSATGANRVYDGTTAATVTLSDNRVAGDTLSTSYTSASFANKNIGTAKSISVTGISLSGTDAACALSAPKPSAIAPAKLAIKALRDMCVPFLLCCSPTAAACTQLQASRIELALNAPVSRRSCCARRHGKLNGL